MNFIIEGGIYFMTPLVLLFFTVIGLLIKGFKNNTKKNISLLKSISLFVFVFGVLGFTIGLSEALEAIALSNNDISAGIVAAGFKIGLIAPTFGTIIFLLGRLGAIVLLWKQKE
ncbi:MAG: hypothetical protein P8K77_00705 [Polaribacter sp.]|nr:hypothetical protein [Polaribacter sp.]